MEVEININWTVTVELTEAGLEKYKEYFRERKLNWMNYAKYHLKGMLLKDSLWQIMHMFGDECFMGNPRQMFVDNRIKIRMEEEE